MALTIGTLLGSLEITAMLGKGGMGEVYRARDTKLKRDVAIKILPDEFARDADRVARFQREAEVLASLSHPNIAGIYDLQHTTEKQFLVLELVEGETLADRIKRGPLPVEEALQIGKSICEALEAAHEKGIVHRDLKPANVKITPDGTVKVLDFGLAKISQAQSRSVLSNSPTLLSASMPGVIMGTASYMSPEQARGREADQRSDVFAFGCVLYEMLTGHEAFQGEDVSDVLAAVLRSEPDFNLLPPKLNPRIREVLRRCLEKNTKLRWHAIGDVRVEIESLRSTPLEALPAPHEAAKPRPLWKRAILVLATALAGAAIASIATWNLKPSPPAAVVARFPVTLPEDQFFFTAINRHIVAISPDSTKLVYVANNQLYLRHLSETEARPIPGTGGDVSSPFFSPDGQWVGFWSSSDSTLKKIAITGGAAITLCKADNPYGVNWDENDIVFSNPPKGILRVSSNGGEPEVLVKMDQELIISPQLLNHGKAVLFTLGPFIGSADRWDQAQIVVQSLSTGQKKMIIRGGGDGRYVPTGHIIYALGGNILAVPFDLKRLQVKGGSVPVIEGVMRGGGTGAAQLAFSANGTLMYIPGATGSAARTTLALADLSGKVQPLPLPPGAYTHPRFSPDGKQLVVGTDDGKDQIVWVYNMSGGTTLRRLTFGGKNQYPMWSNDGRHVIFTSDREGDNGLFWQLADGTGAADRLTKGEQGVVPQAQAIDPSGKSLAFFRFRGSLAGGISMLSMNGDRMPKAFAEAPNTIQPHAAFSPDGRWIAYASSEVPPVQIFVQPYPSTGAKYQITTDIGGAAFPMWFPNGKQILYVFPPKFFVIDVRTEPTFSFGKPTALPITGIVQPVPGQRNFDIAPDGKHLIVVIPVSDLPSRATNPRSAAQINVVMNWFTELQQRVPVK
jgi:serine/threonine-protein kinase